MAFSLVGRCFSAFADVDGFLVGFFLKLVARGVFRRGGRCRRLHGVYYLADCVFICLSWEEALVVYG